MNHEGKTKTFEIIDLINVDGEPEIFEKNSPILPGENLVPENNKNITKKAIKTGTKSLNDAKRNEKKEHLKNQFQQNTEKMNAIKKQK